MEILILTICAVAALGCLCGQITLLVMVLRQGRKTAQTAPAEPEELPEEIEARKAAAEAQRRYEQGFIDIMSYMGQPAGRERE